MNEFEVWLVDKIRQMEKDIKLLKELTGGVAEGLTDIDLLKKDMAEIKVIINRRRKKSRRSPLPLMVRAGVIRGDNFTCRVCGFQDETGKKLQVDHIVPLSDGGTDNESNLQTICHPCHIRKSYRERDRAVENAREETTRK